MKNPLILVSNSIKTYQQNDLTLLKDFAPRQDFIEIGRRLEAELLGYDLFDTHWYQWVRQIEKYLKFDLVEMLSAATQISKYNAVLSTSEKAAIPLAATFYVMRQKIPHIVIAHRLSSTFKQGLFEWWPLYQSFTHIICLCRAQLDYAINKLEVSPSKVDFIYDKVDHRFFRPLKTDTEEYILAVGQEQRDYETLLQAISGTDLKLIVVASSPWSTYRSCVTQTERATILQNIPYQELRALYAKARLVVIPLLDIDYAAGVNSVLEAMAMGKPLIVSHTRGISDYIVSDETGRYVTPGNVEELREVILSLWKKPNELNRLGMNARQAVEDGMNLDNYVNRIVQIVQQSVTM